MPIGILGTKESINSFRAQIQKMKFSLYMGIVLVFLFVYDFASTLILNGQRRQYFTWTETWQFRQPPTQYGVEDGPNNHTLGNIHATSTIAATKSSAVIPRPFPRWGNSTNSIEDNGIDAKPLFDFIVNVSIYAHAPKSRREQKIQSRNRSSNSTSFHSYTATVDHQHDVNHWFPETLYVLTPEGIYTSQLHRDVMNTQGKSTVRDKVLPAEQMMMLAWKTLDEENQTTNAWPHLRQALRNDQDDIPFLAWYGDYTGCNFQNWNHHPYPFSIPLFTLAARVDCNYTFPFPTYRTIGDSLPDESSWDRLFQEYREMYPWERKRRQVIWRGGLTGNIANATHKSPRWNMVRTVQNHALFDVGATRLPKRHDAYRADLERELGGLVPSITPMTDFMKYRGIFDMDGNSWSSRFGNLLCYNSVVLKVEPTWVDYFHFKQQQQPPQTTNQQNDPVLLLQPWKHYIPVRSDLSDLVQMAEFISNPANDAILLSIVENANSWCRHNMIRSQIARDMLDIWDAYVRLLANGNEKNGLKNSWKAVKEQIFAPDCPLNMVPLS
jgi:hypothetical protein